jgi:hypothetical protein
MATKPKLTRKQARFVEAYVETGVGSQAAKKAYDIAPGDENTPRSIASENLTKPNVVKAIEMALPDDLLEQVHREGLFATKGIYVDGDRVDEDADFSVRAKYLDMAYKVKGSYAPDKHVSVHVQAEVDPRLMELAKKLNK